MTTNRRRVSLVLGVLLVGCGPSTAARLHPQELVQVTELVRFLRSRVRGEVPAPDTPAESLHAAFLQELERFGLGLPSGVRLDPGTDDLRVAGLVLEELAYRRQRQSRLAALSEADKILSEEVRALLADAEAYVPEFAPEIAEIFEVLRNPSSDPAVRVGSGRPQAPAPHPRSVAPDARSAPLAPSDPVPDLEGIGAELRRALASSKGAVTVAEDPLFGDPGFVVRSPGLAPVVPSAPVPPVARPSVETLRLEVAARQAGTREVPAPPPTHVPAPASAPAPAPASVRVPVQVKTAAAGPVRPMSSRSPVRTRRPGLGDLLAHLVPDLARQSPEPARFSASLKAALSVLGIRVPGDFAADPGQSAEELARRLESALAGSVSDSTLAAASSALGL